MSTRQIASSTLWQFASQIVMAALSIVTVKIVATTLSQELAGTYNSAYGYLQIFGILADFGLYAVAVRELSRAQNKQHVFGTIIALRVIVLCLSLGLALFVAWLLPMWRGTPLPLSITIAAFVPAFTLLAGILRTIFQVQYRLRVIFIAEVTQRIVTALLMIGLLFTGIRGSADPVILYWLLGFGSVGSLVLLLISLVGAMRLISIRLHWDPVLLRRIVTLALPYGLAFLCTTVYRQSDITLISLLRPEDYDLQNAFYGFVQRGMDMAYILPTFLLNSTLPILSERYEKKEDTQGLLGKTLLAILLIGTTAFLFAIFWSRPLMRLLTTDAYLSTASSPGSDTALWILSISMFMNGVITYSFYVLLTCHRWKPLALTLGIGAIASLVLNSWLIPPLGFVGAAYTSVIIHTGLAVFLLPQGLRALPAYFSRTMLLRWIAFSTLLALALWLLSPFLTTNLATVAALAGSIGLLALLTWVLQLSRLFGR